MPPSNAMENDKKRLRNQFTKDERTRLLAIMTEYGPLLDDKNISILSRKEIWEIIENKFNENGHSGRTSAQLKKYWQNYKYHSKRTKIIHKEVPKPLSPMTKQVVRMLAKVNPEEWAQYDIAVNAAPIKISPGSSKPSPRSKSSAADEDSSIRNAGCKSDISESNVVVSTTDVPGSSVTVSVICPEVSSKARTIFWKRNTLPEKVGSSLHPNYPNRSERVSDHLGQEAGNPDARIQEGDEPLISGQTGKPMRHTNPGNRHSIVRLIAESRPEVKSKESKSVDDHRVRSTLIPCTKKDADNQSQINIKAGRMRRSELIGNVIGVVKEVPTVGAHLTKDCDPMETSGLILVRNGRNETIKTPSLGAGSILNPFGINPTISRENRDTKGDADYLESDEILESSKSTAMTETFHNIGNDLRVEGDPEENGEYTTNRGRDSSTQDFLWLKLYLKFLWSLGQAGGNLRPEILRKFEDLVTATSLMNERDMESEECSDGNHPPESGEGMEVDEDKSTENQGRRLRIRRVSLTAPGVDGARVQPGIKVERETEPEITENPPNEEAEGNGVMNSINYLLQAKLQSAKSEWDHRLKLQKLEIEEKDLRVRIAEMTIQETRLRIQALVEERLRARELHELRLTQVAAEKVCSHAEHGARIDPMCIVTAEDRARINGIERDRERSEHFYQMQLRRMSVGNASGNGNCGVQCKQYQR